MLHPRLLYPGDERLGGWDFDPVVGVELGVDVGVDAAFGVKDQLVWGLEVRHPEHCNPLAFLHKHSAEVLIVVGRRESEFPTGCSVESG